MQERKNNNVQYLAHIQISNLDLEIENHWSPYIEKELLVEVRTPIKRKRNPHSAEFKSFCLLLGVLGLLSIGMCVQADSIAQALRKIVGISVEQTIQGK